MSINDHVSIDSNLMQHCAPEGGTGMSINDHVSIDSNELVARRIAESLRQCGQLEEPALDQRTLDCGNNVRATATTSTRGQSMGSGVLYPELSHAIVGAGIEVHRHIGPGQLECVYQRAFEHELELRGIPFRSQVPIAMVYKGRRVGDFFADLIVDRSIIVELKAVERYHPLYTSQVLSYLRATNLRLGLLMNFNWPVLHQAVRRIVL